MGIVAVIGQQRRQPQHRIARIHIVGINLGQVFEPLQLQCAGQQLGQNAGRRHHPQHRLGTARFQQAQQLLGDAFRRQGFQLVLRRRGGAQAVRINVALAVPGMEAEQPQHPQIVFGDAGGRIAHEAHPAGNQVFHPGGIVIDRAIQGGVEGVDGEVTPGRVFRPVIGEGDLGVTAIGFHIAAQGRDLEGMGAGDGGDGAMVQARGDHLDAVVGQMGQRLAGRHGHRDVYVRHGRAQQRIAHGAANEPRFAQCGEDLKRFRRRHPGMGCGINSHRRPYNIFESRRSARLTMIAAVAPQISWPSWVKA